MAVFVVLLRAIGPVTHKVMSMAQWRDATEAAGFRNPQTYVATGNMIVDADGTASEVAARMEQIITGLGLGSANKAFVRTATDMQALCAANPFPEATAQHPSDVAAYFFADEHPRLDWVNSFTGPEHIRIVAQHLVVDYHGGASASRLPGRIEKLSGVATARNWNTVRGLAERAAAREN
ncbi:hypothetical protein WH87_06015 [Devosia epidermidihirudinis]|uniref:DUF1697 domain-containing protein n=1 Tax=Devosia epidermidihirudinis TaxID=1293439 RepID=A0A0F5QFF0_9HYPH|nr:DUF1697 domain-containing protein [Devosia epidermidihirudinis]KKC39702.1 hypothetical protein WH87_06015 [Devosia epidermidihirudinis]